MNPLPPSQRQTMQNQNDLDGDSQLLEVGIGGRPRLGNRTNTQSRRLPQWLWFLIMKILVIKQNPNDNMILGYFLFGMTILSATGYMFFSLWFTIYDIKSNITKTTVIDGCAKIIFEGLWVSLGIYAYQVAQRLFKAKKISHMIRLHSKTILKVNAAIMILILMVLLVVINDISSYPAYYDTSCSNAKVSQFVCELKFIFRVIYSSFAVLWNYLVAFIVISVCRTHTIGIRQFMEKLEEDSNLLEYQVVNMNRGNSNLIHLNDNQDGNDGLLQNPGPNPTLTNEQQNGNETIIENQSNDSSDVSLADGNSLPIGLVGTSLANPALGDFDEVDHIRTKKLDSPLSNSQILYNYWKIQCRLRITSSSLQRWMMSIVSLVIVWVAMNLVLWLNHDPSILDLVNFILPILVLPLLTSCYAEVNLEGTRLIKFIYPSEERLRLIFNLQQMPLDMNVFGFTLSYSSITTALIGVLLALSSKILLQEVNS